MVPSREPCAFFARNACKSGDRCRFAHVHKQVSQTPSPGLCQFFLRGSCHYGDKCFNIHSREQNLAPSLTLCKFYLQGQCKSGSDCAYRHGQGPSRVSPCPGSANSLATDTQLSPLESFNMLPMRSMPTSPRASPRPASSASLHVRARTSDVSVSEVSSNLDGAGDAQETAGHESQTADNLKTDVISSPDASMNAENATSDVGQDASTYHGKWEMMDDIIRSQDASANSINKTEESRTDELPSASISFSPSPIGFPPPFVTYAPQYYGPNLYALASQYMPNYYAPNPYHAYALPALSMPVRTCPRTPSSQSQASSFTPVSSDAALCQQHTTYGYCPIGTACRFRHYLTDKEFQQLSSNRQSTRTPANTQQDSVLQKKESTWKTKTACRNRDGCSDLHTFVPSSQTVTIDQESEPSEESSPKLVHDYGWGASDTTKWDVVEESKETTDNSGWGTTAPDWGAAADGKNNDKGWGDTSGTTSDWAADDLKAKGWGDTSGTTSDWTADGLKAKGWGDTNLTKSTPLASWSKSKYENNRGSGKRNDGGRRPKDVVPKSKATHLSNRPRETHDVDARHERDTPPHQRGGRNRKTGWESERTRNLENERKRDWRPSVKAPSSPRAIVEAISADTSRWL